MGTENLMEINGVGVGTETFEAAKQLLHRRFKFIKDPDESMKWPDWGPSVLQWI